MIQTHQILHQQPFKHSTNSENQHTKIMAPTKEELNSIASQAERELNTYQAKTGVARGTDIDEAGVDTRVEKKFPGAEVRYHPEMSTSASYNRRIPPEEGGDLDDKGR